MTERVESQMEDRCGAELIWTRQRGTEDGNSQTKPSRDVQRRSFQAFLHKKNNTLGNKELKETLRSFRLLKLRQR